MSFKVIAALYGTLATTTAVGIGVAYTHGGLGTGHGRNGGAETAAVASHGGYVDDDAQIQRAADPAHELEIGALGVGRVLTRMRDVGVTGMGVLVIGIGVVVARCTHQLQNILGDAVHIDGERNAAVAHQREA